MTKLLNEIEAADALGVSKGTLANWRCSRLGGPSFVKVGRLVRYRADDIEQFIERQTVNPTDTREEFRARNAR